MHRLNAITWRHSLSSLSLEDCSRYCAAPVRDVYTCRFLSVDILVASDELTSTLSEGDEGLEMPQAVQGPLSIGASKSMPISAASDPDT